MLSGSWAMDGGPATAVSYNIGGLGTGAQSAMFGSVTMSASGTASFANTSVTGFLSPTSESTPAAGFLSAVQDVYINPSATVSGTPNVKIRMDYVVD